MCQLIRWLPAFALAVAFAALTASAAAAPYSRMVVFGDSYEDVGNVSRSSPYYMNRASNGPVWVEDLASRLELPALVRSSAGGAYATDYAWSGAAASGSYINGAPDLASQVSSYLRRGAPAGDELIVIKIGGNDLLFGPANPTTASAAVKNQITRLAGQGAKNFLIANEPPLGALPRYHGTSDEARVTNLGDRFNQALLSDVTSLRTTLDPDTHLYFFDLNDFFKDTLANPQPLGFANVTQGAMNVGAREPDKYLFWDDFHPTKVMHEFIADEAFKALPEPSALASLMGLGAAGLLQRRRRSRT